MRAELIVSALALTLAGCVPVSNHRHHAPEVSGTLARNGVPVADAEVILTSRFYETTATGRSDADGRFRLGPLSERRLTRSVIGDPLYAYALSIRVEGEKEYPGLSGHGTGDAPERLQVTCDLGRPVGQGQSLRYCSHDRSAQSDGPAAGTPGR